MPGERIRQQGSIGRHKVQIFNFAWRDEQPVERIARGELV